MLSRISNLLLRPQAIIFAIKIIGATLAVATNIVITRLLGATDAGRYFVSISYLTILYAVARFGFGYSTYRFAAQAHAEKNFGQLRAASVISASVVAIVSIFVSIISSIVIHYSAVFSGRFSDISPVLSILVIAIPFYCVASIFGEVLKGMRNFLEYSLIESVASKIFPIICMAALFTAIGARGVFFGYVVGMAVSFLVAAFLLYTKVPGEIFKANMSIDIRDFFKSTGILSIFSIVSVASTWAPTIITGAALNARDAGVYFAAFRMAALSEFVVVSAGAVLGPQLVSLLASGEAAAAPRLVLRNALSVTAFVAALCAPLLLLPKLAMGLYGTEYASHYYVLPILALGQIVSAPLTLGVSVLTAFRKEAWIAMTTVAAFAVSAVTMLILAERFGLLGAAIGGALAPVIQNAALFFLANRELRRHRI